MREKSNITTSKIWRILCIVVGVWIVWCFITTRIQIDTETEIIKVGNRYAVLANGTIFEGGKSYEDKSLQTATLFGKSATSLISARGKVNVNKVGEYRIIYEPIFSLISFKKKVKVVDVESPKIELLGKKKFCIKHMYFYSEPGYKATDNYDGDITDKVKVENVTLPDGSTKFKYYVKDSSGNSVIEEREFLDCKGAVYLTFDDGPSTENTIKILDILKDKNVKATFFIINYDKSKNEIVKRMKDEGHTIGIHGYSHEYSEVYASLEDTMNNFYKMNNLLNETVGYNSKVVRFIGGSSNTISKKYCTGVITEATKRLENEGYRYFDWNVDSGDSVGKKTAEEIYENVINGIRPNRDNIVLMHDTNLKDSTVEALGDIIDYCIENGYCIEPIRSDTPVLQHKIAN